MKNLKTLFTESLIAEVRIKMDGGPIRVLDIGCGTVAYIAEYLKTHKEVTYVGIEPIAASFQKALVVTKDMSNVTLIEGLAYGRMTGLEENSFDVVFSQSVLEHVKHLKPFLEFSVRYTKVGGAVVHRYDLGHALYPHNFKAKLHVWLGNHVPAILPERQFVRYVPESEVLGLYKEVGLQYQKTTWHQFVSHKQFESALKNVAAPLANETVAQLYQLETEAQSALQELPVSVREQLCPSVAVWGIKQ